MRGGCIVRLLREAPDIIYQQVGCAHTGIAAYYAKRRKCRMVWRVASDSDAVRPKFDWRRPHLFVERLFLEYGIRNADLIIAQTRHQQRLLANDYNRSDAIVIPNFHPAPTGFTPGQMSHERRKLVVWIANLKPLKNPEAFVRLAARFSERQDVEFVMIGASARQESVAVRDRDNDRGSAKPAPRRRA